MQRDEIIKACELKASGYTYREIGDFLGCSGQNVQQTLKQLFSEDGRRVSEKTIYPNLEREIKVKYKSLRNFAEQTGFVYIRLLSILHGKSKLLFDEAILISDILGKDVYFLFRTKE